MADISRAASFGKLNPILYKAIEGATVFAKLRGNPYVELIHWVNQILQAQDTDVLRILRHFGVEKIGMVAVVNPPQLHQGVHVVEKGLIVVAHPARVVVDDVFEPGRLIPDFQQLVDLFLILHRREAHGGILEDEQHFRRHRILIERHRHASQALRRAHHHVQMRAVVADDGEVVAALETQRRQAARQGTHPFGDLGPSPDLPDAEIFLADGGRVAPRPGVVKQQARKSPRPVRIADGALR